MKELEKWQIISFISRGFATFVGLVQSFLIIRILTVGEWGIVQLAASIGGVLGIYQHLGLASATTREISSAKDDRQVYKIFVSSVAIRYLITVPLAVGLFIFAKQLGTGLYKNNQLVLPLQIYAVTLLFGGFQSLLNSIISGTQRFKRLFLYQAFVAILSLMIFLPLVYISRINGYYWAYLIFNVLNTLFLFYLAFSPLKTDFALPSKREFAEMFKKIFSFSMAIYLVKILATNWEKLGSNLLGLYESPEIVGFIAFALLYSKKILSISDAVTDVSLPVLSDKYTRDIEDFKQSFAKNFDKIFLAIIVSSIVAGFWAPQIIEFLVGTKYAAAYPVIPITLFAYVIYSFMDIVKSSVLVPAKLVREMVVSYILLLLVTALVFLGEYKLLQPLISVTAALAVGVTAAFIYLSLAVRKRISLPFFGIKHTVLFLLSFVFVGFGIYGQASTKPVAFLLFILLFGSLVYIFKLGYADKENK